MDNFIPINIQDLTSATIISEKDFLPIAQGSKDLNKVKLRELAYFFGLARGVVEEGNTQAVSGGEVYDKIEVINDLIASFSGQIGSGIIGEAFPETVPISEGFGIYTVSTAGVYTNFLDSSGNPIEVLESDLVGSLIQLWGSNNVWEMNVTQVNSNDPESSETGYIQVT